jgi:hypothetical protein
MYRPAARARTTRTRRTGSRAMPRLPPTHAFGKSVFFRRSKIFILLSPMINSIARAFRGTYIPARSSRSSRS